MGGVDYNAELSVERAGAARAYLVKTYQVEPSRIDTSGLGESQPLVPGTGDEARAMNRRVVLEMLR